ncbi:MAG TPA: hypothetical protein VM802_29945 [Chitinophaga sp.]|uniref:hypothetical protein n=1 Tax=Chitinophaga sp. TaxID=1869181 RepID=UPI002CCE1B4C|nr:hypothetical protein [Chitinophaga sp.]HVI49127.1 hypothetical protein [Chitinophaga sp.]
MLKLNHNRLLQFAAALFLLSATTACSSKKEDPVPVDPPTGPIYQMRAVYVNGTRLDSFIYDNGLLKTAWFYDEKGKDWEYSNYIYKDGLVTRSENYQTSRTTQKMFLASIDSVVRSTGKLAVYHKFFDEATGQPRGTDSTNTVLDASNRIVAIGSKDTIRTQWSKSVDYIQITFTGNNLTMFDYNGYYESLSGPGSKDVFTSKYTLEYGNNRNVLYAEILKNPPLALEVLDVKYHFLWGANDVVKMKIIDGDVPGDIIITNKTVSNTNYISEQSYTSPEGPVKITYTYNVLN